MFQCNSTSVEMVGPRICRCQIADISIHCLKQMAPYIDCLAVKSKIQIKCSSFFFLMYSLPPYKRRESSKWHCSAPQWIQLCPCPSASLSGRSRTWRTHLLTALLLIVSACMDDSKRLCQTLILYDPHPQLWWLLVVSSFLLAFNLWDSQGPKSGLFPSRENLYTFANR